MSRGEMRRLGSSDDFLGHLHPVGCPKCSRAWLVPTGGAGTTCPGCGVGKVAPQPAVVRAAEPELIVPFGASKDDLVPALRKFAGSFWFRARDLNADNLARRAIAVWWPVWLVDATCIGRFNAEVGFDYAVKSSDEVLENGSWRTKEVMRTKIRWEPRLGGAVRHYDNVPAEALTEHDALWKAVGAYDYRRAIPYTNAKLADAWVRLPDRSPDEAWPDAEAGFVKRLTRDVQRAVTAEHARGVTVAGDYENVNFTWMLLPMYATWYTDDGGTRRVVLFHGETAQAYGPKMASVMKGLLWGGIIALLATGVLVVAALVGLIGLAVVPLLVVALLIACVGGAMYLVALWPPLHAWSRNRRELAAFHV